MNDSISRAAAINLLKRWSDGYPYIETETELAIKEFQELPSAQPKQRWIPCSERLPEYDGEMYLVTDYCEQINRRRLHISYCYVNREGFWSDVPMGYKVIAWMPLPKPWKGEKDG